MADTEAQLQRHILHLVHHHGSPCAERVCGHRILVFQVQLSDPHILFALLQRRPASRARLHVDGGETLGGLRPIALCLENLAEQFPDHEVLLFEGDYAASQPVQRVHGELLELAILELVHLLGHLATCGALTEDSTTHANISESRRTTTLATEMAFLRSSA